MTFNIIKLFKKNDTDILPTNREPEILSTVDRYFDKKLSYLSHEDRAVIRQEFLKGYFLQITDHGKYAFEHPLFIDFFVGENIIANIEKGNVTAPIVMDYQWNHKVIDFIYDDLQKSNSAQKHPSIYTILSNNNYPEAENDKEKIKKQSKNSIIWKAIGSGAIIYGQPILLLLGITTLFCAYMGYNGLSIGIGVLGLLVISGYAYTVTMRQKMHDLLHRYATSNKKNKYPINAKAYQIAFTKDKHSGFSVGENLKIFRHLLSKYDNLFQELKGKEYCFHEGVIFKHNWFGVRFEDISFTKSDFIIGNIKYSELKNIDLSASQFLYVIIEDTQLINLDFSKLKLISPNRFIYLKIIRYLLKWSWWPFPKELTEDNSGRGIKKDRPLFFYIEFRNIKRSQMDDFTLNSLKVLIQKYHLNPEKHFSFVDSEWIRHELRN